MSARELIDMLAILINLNLFVRLEYLLRFIVILDFWFGKRCLINITGQKFLFTWTTFQRFQFTWILNLVKGLINITRSEASIYLIDFPEVLIYLVFLNLVRGFD